MGGKKFKIIASIVVIVAILGFYIGFGFKVKTISVEVVSKKAEDSKIPSNISDQVILAGDFKFGSNLLFLNTSKNIQKAEKVLPYIKIEQVIRKFSNSLRVRVSERIERFRIRDKNETEKWYIMDKEFKILDVETINDIENSEYKDCTYIISPNSYTIESGAVGDFVNDATVMDMISCVASGIYGKYMYDAKSIKIIEFSFEDEFNLSISMKKEGSLSCKILVEGNYDLKERVESCLIIYKEKESQTDGNDTITASKNKNSNGTYDAVYSPGE